MTIGLVLLAVVAILIFFGVSERFFRALGLSNWLAFLLVFALIVGAIVPAFTIKAFSFNLGGFAVPLVIMVVLMLAMQERGEPFRAILGSLAVAAVAVGTRMLIEPGSGGLILASSLIVGFAGGVVAFLVGQTRLSMLAAAIGGIILGDVIVNFLYTFAIGGYSYMLGSYGVFDSVVIAATFGVLIHGAVGAIQKTASHRLSRKSNSKDGQRIIGARTAGAIESSEDQHFDELRIDTGDADTEKELNSVPDSRELSPSDPLSTDGFFDDYI